MAELAPSRHRTLPLILLDLGTLGVVLAWLALACYAVAYLASQ